MKILSVDTTHGVCSVALWNDNTIISDVTDNDSGKQAERLLSIIEKVLKETNTTYADLDAIAVNVGPGSFTGVRIGLSAVKGISLVYNTPTIGISSLETIAYSVFKDKLNKNILAALDAKRGQIFCQMFAPDLQPLSEPVLLGYDNVSDIITEDDFIITGNGSGLIEKNLHSRGYNFSIKYNDATSNACNIAYLGACKFNNNPSLRIYDISPVYIRKPDAKM